MKSVKGRTNPIDGKVAVIVGGASGIGRGIALDFASNNAYVAVLDIAHDAGEKLVSEINASFGKELAKYIYCDVSVEETVRDAFREVVRVFNGIDVLIYSVGIVKAGSVKDYRLEDFEMVTKVNYTGYFA